MTHYINCLPVDAQTAIALGLTIINHRTQEERCIDALLVDDRLPTVFAAVRDKFGANWMLFESWPIDNPMMQAAA
jgi:hypothetical protein